MSKRPSQRSNEPAGKTTAKASGKQARPAAKAPAAASKPAAKTTSKPAASASTPAKTSKPAASASTPAKPSKPAASASTPAKPSEPSANTSTTAKTAAKPNTKTSGVSARAVVQAAREAEAASKPTKPAAKPPGRVRKAVESVIALAGEVLERVTGGEPPPLTAYLADTPAAAEVPTPDPAGYLADEAVPEDSRDPGASAGHDGAEPTDPSAYAAEPADPDAYAAEPADPSVYASQRPVPEDSLGSAEDDELRAYLGTSRPGPTPHTREVHLGDEAAPVGEVLSIASEVVAGPAEVVRRAPYDAIDVDLPTPGSAEVVDAAPSDAIDVDPAKPSAEVVSAAPTDAIDVDAAPLPPTATPDAYLDPDAVAASVSPVPAAYLASTPRTPNPVVYLADPPPTPAPAHPPRPEVPSTPAPNPVVYLADPPSPSRTPHPVVYLADPSPAPVTPSPSSPSLGDLDLHLLAEGTHLRLYERLGAQVQPDGGVHFAVWAPNARQVSVIGEWNRWQPGLDRLTRHPSGVWQGHVPAAAVGMLYKYRVVGLRGEIMDRADPVALASEGPPQTASRIATLEYAWNDAAWLRERATRQSAHAPISVYEMHVGSWLRGPQGDFLSYRELAPRLIAHLRALGFTHVEFMPLTEHPFYGSWGYQTSAYFAPSARYGGPQALMYLIDELHQAGFGVILDWVPGHFPADDHGLGRFDGTYLYEHRDPRRGHQPDWNTLIFNLGRHEVRAFLLSSAMMWIERYHVDGIRVDAVASMLYLDYSRKPGEWLPNEHGGRENLEAVAFLRALNEVVHAQHPGVITIAEESTSWPLVTGPVARGGLGFDYKWDMGWMHDSLRYLGRDPILRQHHHDELTFRMWYAYNERYMLPLSHDEVVHGKGSLIRKTHGDAPAKFAGLRLLLAYMFTTPGKKLLFMGAEFAQIREWNHDRQLDWALRELPMHAGLERWVARLAHLYRDDPALHELDHDPAGFEWLVVDDRQRSLAVYLRLPSRGPVALIALNFTPVTWTDHRIGVPAEGTYTLVDRSDAAAYTDEHDVAPVSLPTSFEATPEPAHERPFSITVTLPPLTALVLAGPEAGELREAAEWHRAQRLAREAAAALAAEAAAAEAVLAATAAAAALAALEARAAAPSSDSPASTTSSFTTSSPASSSFASSPGSSSPGSSSPGSSSPASSSPAPSSTSPASTSPAPSSTSPASTSPASTSTWPGSSTPDDPRGAGER